MANTQGVPTVEGYQLQSVEYQSDPVAYLHTHHRDEPVLYWEGPGMWVITRHADVRRGFTEYPPFSNSSFLSYPIGPDVAPSLPEDTQEVLDKIWQGQVNGIDPPEHTRERKVAQTAFKRSRVRDILPYVQSVTTDLVDQIEADDSETFDLMGDFAYNVPARVTGRLMGLPEKDLPRLRTFAENVLSLEIVKAADMSGVERPADEIIEAYKKAYEGAKYFATLVEELGDSDEDVLAATMLALRDEDGNQMLSAEDVVAHLVIITTAGSETTANLVGNVVRVLTAHPDLRDRVMADPQLWPKIIEETLRRYPVAHQLARYVMSETEVAGVRIPEGVIALMSVAGAHGDERVFPNPLEFDIDRPNMTEQLGFGIGRHFCLGAPLAREESEVILKLLYDRFPGMTADLDEPEKFTPPGTFLPIRSRQTVTK